MVKRLILKLIRYGILLALALPLAINSMYTIYDTLDRHLVLNPYNLTGLGSMVLLTAIVVFAVRAGLRSKKLHRLPEKKFLLLYSAISLAISLVSIFSLPSLPQGDLLMYHNDAVRIVEGDFSFSYLLQHLHAVYLRRALVNLAPLYMITGPNLLAVQLFNVFINIATGLLIYFFIRQSFKSILIARLSLLFYFLLPITYLTLNVPSHDIAGLFYLMVCFTLFERMDHFLSSGKRWPLVFILSLLLGVMLFILQLSRSIGLFCFYALFMFLLVSLLDFFPLREVPKKYPYLIKRTLFLFIIPMAVYYFLSGNLISSNINQGRFIMMFVATDTCDECEGAYSEIADAKGYYNSIPAGHRNDMALGKFRSELYYNAPDFLELLIKKNRRLYGLGNDKSWLMGVEKNKEIVFLTQAVWFGHPVIRSLLFVLGLFGLIYLGRKYRLGSPFSFLVYYWLTCSLLLTVIGEVSPRYSYLFIPGIVALAAVGFVALPALFRDLAKTVTTRPRRFLLYLGVWAGLAAMVVLALAITRNALERRFAGDELVYRDLRSATITPGSPERQAGAYLAAPVNRQAQPMKYGISLPDENDSVRVSWTFPVTAGGYYQARGFIREPATRDQRLRTTLTLRSEGTDAANISSSNRRVLRKRKDYAVRYFASEPMLAESGWLSLDLKARSGEGALYSADSTARPFAYLEFLQIVRVDPDTETGLILNKKTK